MGDFLKDAEDALVETIDLTLNSKYTHGALIYGPAGLRKTHMVIKILRERGAQFEVYNTHLSALGLYEALYRNLDKVVVLDDVDDLFDDKKAVSILKSALFSVEEKRKVCWASTASVMFDKGIPNAFDFCGKVIIILNDLPALRSSSLKALESRLYTHRLKISLEARKMLIRSIILKQDIFGLSEADKQRVIDSMECLVGAANAEQYNLRTVMKACEIYKIKGDAGLPLIRKLIVGDDKMLKFIYIEEHGKNLTVGQKIEVWKRSTGLSTQSYYNTRAKYLAEIYGDSIERELEEISRAIESVGGYLPNTSETKMKE